MHCSKLEVANQGRGSATALETASFYAAIKGGDARRTASIGGGARGKKACHYGSGNKAFSNSISVFLLKASTGGDKGTWLPQGVQLENMDDSSIAPILSRTIQFALTGRANGEVAENGQWKEWSIHAVEVP